MPLSAPIRETGNGKRDQLLSEPGPNCETNPNCHDY
jgi:hypothetical protein